MEAIDWVSREMILSYIAVIGAIWKAGKAIYARAKAEAREQLLAEQSVATTEAKNKELQEKEETIRREREARERAERIAENLRRDLDTCQTEKGRLWTRVERLEGAS